MMKNNTAISSLSSSSTSCLRRLCTRARGFHNRQDQASQDPFYFPPRLVLLLILAVFLVSLLDDGEFFDSRCAVVVDDFRGLIVIDGRQFIVHGCLYYFRLYSFRFRRDGIGSF